jgi:hypothetical protein
MYEYHDKWIHYEIKLADGTFADGHIAKICDDRPRKTVTVIARPHRERRNVALRFALAEKIKMKKWKLPR